MATDGKWDPKFDVARTKQHLAERLKEMGFDCGPGQDISRFPYAAVEHLQKLHNARKAEPDCLEWGLLQAYLRLCWYKQNAFSSEPMMAMARSAAEAHK